MTRKERLFAEWDVRCEKLTDAIMDVEKNGIEITDRFLRKSLGVQQRDVQLFMEWAAHCGGVSTRGEVTEEGFWEAAHHEAGHATTGDLLIPGSVRYTYCTRSSEGIRGANVRNIVMPDRRLWETAQGRLFIIYNVACFMAGGLFEVRLAGSSKAKIFHRAYCDRQMVRQYLDWCGLSKAERLHAGKSAEGVLDRLASSNPVCAAVKGVAGVLIRDGRISGERIRNIIATEIGPTEKLLSSLDIPRLELGPGAKAA
jgi:hypothetical protein